MGTYGKAVGVFVIAVYGTNSKVATTNMVARQQISHCRRLRPKLPFSAQESGNR
jgi:hypothetical protein